MIVQMISEPMMPMGMSRFGFFRRLSGSRGIAPCTREPSSSRHGSMRVDNRRRRKIRSGTCPSHHRLADHLHDHLRHHRRVFTGMIPYGDLVKKLSSEQAEPLTLAMKYATMPNWMVGVVAFGSVVAHTAVLLVFQLGQPRIFFAMSRDGLLPPFFSRVHPKFGTPHVATIITGIFVGVAALFSSLDAMVDLTNIGTLFAFLLVCIGIIILRVKDPHRERSFRVPAARGSSPFSRTLLHLPGEVPSEESWYRFGIWLLVGMVVYLSYGYRHSRLKNRGGPGSPEAWSRTTQPRAAVAGRGMWTGLRDHEVFTRRRGGRFGFLRASAAPREPVSRWRHHRRAARFRHRAVLHRMVLRSGRRHRGGDRCEVSEGFDYFVVIALTVASAIGAWALSVRQHPTPDTRHPTVRRATFITTAIVFVTMFVSTIIPTPSWTCSMRAST